MSSARDRPKKPRCGRCLHPGYDVDRKTHDGRPRFTCQRCGEWWTAGKDGGEWATPKARAALTEQIQASKDEAKQP